MPVDETEAASSATVHIIIASVALGVIALVNTFVLQLRHYRRRGVTENVTSFGVSGDFLQLMKITDDLTSRRILSTKIHKMIVEESARATRLVREISPDNENDERTTRFADPEWGRSSSDPAAIITHFPKTIAQFHVFLEQQALKIRPELGRKKGQSIRMYMHFLQDELPFLQNPETKLGCDQIVEQYEQALFGKKIVDEEMFKSFMQKFKELIMVVGNGS